MTAPTEPLTIAAAARELSPERVYLDTATLGLPPTAVARALHDAVDAWSLGSLCPRGPSSARSRRRARGGPVAGHALLTRRGATRPQCAAAVPGSQENCLQLMVIIDCH